MAHLKKENPQGTVGCTGGVGPKLGSSGPKLGCFNAFVWLLKRGRHEFFFSGNGKIRCINAEKVCKKSVFSRGI